MELASTSESLVKNRFISRKNTSCYFPSRTERQNPNETLFETKVTRLLSDSEKGKTEGRCGEIRTGRILVFTLFASCLSFPCRQFPLSSPSLSSSSFLPQSSSMTTRLTRCSQACEYLCWIVWPLQGVFLPLSLGLLEKTTGPLALTWKGWMDGWVSVGHACLTAWLCWCWAVAWLTELVGQKQH